jgi:predicted nucleic acid-binding protein
LVVPLRTANTTLLQRYELFFQQQIILDIKPSIYRSAAALRSRHRLKIPDALHLATADHYGCNEFWTNDDRLNKAATNKAINLLSGLRN